MEIAQSAIMHLAADEDQALALMQNAGISPDELRRRIGEPEFLGGVLDFVLGDDQVATSFCTAEGISGETLMRARHALPGAASDYV